MALTSAGPVAEVRAVRAGVARAWSTGRRPLAAVAATALVTAGAMGEHSLLFRSGLERYGAERPALPLPLAAIRLPLSLFLTTPSLPFWGAAVQVLLAVAAAELLFGWRRTVLVGVLAHAAATVSARVMVTLGHGPLALPARFLDVRDTGPSAAVVGIAVYAMVRYRTPWLLAALVGALGVELAALPNLAGREHIAAVIVGAGCAFAEEGLSRVTSSTRAVADVSNRRAAFVTARRLARLTRLIALVTLVSALSPAAHGRLHLLMTVVPKAAPAGAAAGAAVSGVLLLLIAHGLAGRKRRAWQSAVLLLALSTVFHLLKGLDVEEAAACFAVLVVLVWQRRVFTALPSYRSRRTAFAALAALLGFDLAVGMILLMTDPRHAVGHRTWGAMASTVLRGLLGISGPLALTGRRGDTIGDLFIGFTVLTVAVPVWLALRPGPPAAVISDDDAAQMRTLIDRYGELDSLAYFALRRDKAVVWSPTRKSAIAYRVVSGVMLASGDPLGDCEAWPPAIDAFLKRADTHGWLPAVVSCSHRGAQVWSRAGLVPLELGDEAVVDVASFSLDGRAMRNVRQAVRRVERAGYTAEVVLGRDLTAEARALLRTDAARWHADVTERGFSMALGRLGAPVDDTAVLVFARDGEGTLRGLLQLVPWGSAGWSLDVMRRDPEAANGINELLITAALRAARDLGIGRLSLNFAMFRRTLEHGERLGAGVVAVALRRVLVEASRWWQIESLYRFNSKFQPEWETRYVCSPTRADLPRVIVATLIAEALVQPPRRLGRSRRLAFE